MSKQQNKQPNIILILMDDLGYSDLGYLGGDIPTPTIDHLAHTGIRLNYHYAENVCSATRSALLTGRYAWKSGLDDVIGPPSSQGIDTSFKLISDVLSNNHYDTLFVGKWHIGSAIDDQLPHLRGFKHSLYFINGQTNYTKHDFCQSWFFVAATGITAGEIDLHGSTIPTLNQQLPNGFCGYDLWFDNHQSYITYDTNQYIEDLFANRIHTFLKTRKKNRNKKPFFIYWSLPTPHTPITTPPLTSSECDYLIGETRQKQCNMVYYADLLINNMIKQLKHDKFYKNTLIIFVSDNGAQPALPIETIGGSAGQPLPFRGSKINTFEGGIRTPAFFSGNYLKKMFDSDPGAATG
eukprot:757590_1